MRKIEKIISIMFIILVAGIATSFITTPITAAASLILSTTGFIGAALSIAIWFDGGLQIKQSNSKDETQGASE